MKSVRTGTLIFRKTLQFFLCVCGLHALVHLAETAKKKSLLETKNQTFDTVA